MLFQFLYSSLIYNKYTYQKGVIKKVIMFFLNPLDSNTTPNNV